MSRRFKGPNQAYQPGGQAHLARQSMMPREFAQRRHLRDMHTDPEALRKQVPRITWAELLKQAGRAAEFVAHANERPVGYHTMTTLPKRYCTQAALALYDCGAPIESVRAAVEHAWIVHSTMFMALAGDDALPILRHCRFDPPSAAETFTVWRGTRAVDLDKARAGMSWSLSRKVACTWAIHIGVKHGVRIAGAPLVVRRHVRREDVIFYTDENDMQEVVIDAPPDGDVDGDAEEWAQTARNYAAALTWQQAEDRAGGVLW